jgi:cysteinyl-tRNA synthetase
MKEINIYNTLGRKKEVFKPLNPDEVSIYHCGPTVYWVQHIGNMRAMVMGDLIRRSLIYMGYKVRYVRNYTDFGHLVSDSDDGEDKMEKGAKREGISTKEIAEKYIKIFDKDVENLNTLPATKSTRATDYVDRMISIIQDLLDKGIAYPTPEAIYFDISKANDYTALSGQKLDKLLSGAGQGEGSGEHKKNPADFALWFFRTGTHEKSSLYWQSPFESELVKDGEGIPGWHIECSAMSLSELGDTLDIHMGGVEHIPIHHTNEIAQSEGYTGKKFANFWLHNEHLTVNGGKMSKSEGTSIVLDDVINKGFDPLDLRYLFLQAHYRSKQDFTWETLDSARTAYKRLIEILKKKKGEGKISRKYKERFEATLANDFNIPQALSILWDMLSDGEISNGDAYITALDFDNVLGLKLEESVSSEAEIPSDVQELVNQRSSAREDKDFEKSDELRSEIEKLGYEVLDTADGQKVKKN